jgi:glycosyltransferase involved in cell wall biosynthesis
MTTDLFTFFRQSPMRRDLISGNLQDPAAHYLLYGMDHLSRCGLTYDHNLVGQGNVDIPQGRLAHWLGYLTTRLGGIGGDYQTILSHRRRANRSAVILSTVDTVGIPLVLFKRAGLIHPPLVYISIGLPERIGKMPPGRIQAFYRNAYRGVSRFIAYGWEEAEWLRRWQNIPENSTQVVFLPFGVDADHFAPCPDVTPTVDVLTIGADPQRDFKALFEIAARHQSLKFRVIAGAAHAATLSSAPRNVEVLIDVPFSEMRRHLAGARVIALPIHENTYSAGTTTLLQAMSMARPVVVSQTGAIRQGYELMDRGNCRLVAPGNTPAFEAALLDTLHEPEKAIQMGLAARQTIVQHLTWRHYEDRLFAVLQEARQQATPGKDS